MARGALEEDDSPRPFDMMESFGLRVRQAMNQVVVRTVMAAHNHLPRR